MVPEKMINEPKKGLINSGDMCYLRPKIISGWKWKFQERQRLVPLLTRARSGTKAREIMKLYPKEKAESLIQRLRQKGLWYFDSDFPGDEEDPMVKVKDMFRVTCFKMLNSIMDKAP